MKGYKKNHCSKPTVGGITEKFHEARHRSGDDDRSKGQQTNGNGSSTKSDFSKPVTDSTPNGRVCDGTKRKYEQDEPENHRWPPRSTDMQWESIRNND